MTEQAQEFSGKTVEEAISDGLRALNATEDQVQIEIINKGSRGILGFGSEPALVRMAPKSPNVDDQPAEQVDTADVPAALPSEEVESEPTVETPADPVAEAAVEAPADDLPEDHTADDGEAEIDATTDASDDAISDDDLTEMAADLLGRMIDLMGFEADVFASWQEADETTGSPYLLLDIRGDNLGALIGRRGETLSSIQYLLRLMVNQQVKQWKNIVVDVEQYKQRRVTQLSQLAERMARQVAETGRSVTLEPMPGNERRIVHMALRDHPDVFTESTGDGERRKVNIFPRHE